MEKIVFIKNDSYFIPGVYTYPDTNGKYPAVLLLHGLLSCKSGDGFMLEKIAEALAENGIASLRIDFCSCGESRRSRRDYNILSLTKEAKTAYKHMQDNELIDKNRIAILGHSYGGVIAFKTADLNPKCIITLNGAMTSNLYEDYLQTKDEYLIDKNGYKYTLIPQSDGRIELMYSNFFELHIKHNYNYPKYDGRILMCIGVNDPRISPEDGKKFFDSLENENKELIIIDDANHTFNAKTLDYTKLNELMDKVNEWLNKNLK